MNSRNRKTFEAVFSHPTKSNICWSDIEALLMAVGAELSEGSGSRVIRFFKDGDCLTAHRPHPGKEAKPYQVRDVRAFLEMIGVKP